jgi:hypothetical protein
MAGPIYCYTGEGITNSASVTTGKVGIGTTDTPDLVVVQGSNAAINIRDGSATTCVKLGLSSDEGRLLLYDGGAAKLDLKANGASYFNGGNVGVGTSTPDCRLDVSASGGASGSNKVLRLRAGNNTTYFGNSQVVLSWNGGTDYSHAIKSRHNSAADAGNAIDFYVWDYGTDAAGAVGTKHVMSLDGGNVGIGTTSPNTAYRLQVVGNFRVESSPIFYATYSGIGIGVESPTSELTVDGNIETADGHKIITDQIRARDSDGLKFTDAVDNVIAFAANSGFFGIGTSSPSAELSVMETVRISAALSPNTPAAGVTIYWDGTDLKARRADGKRAVLSGSWS